MRAPDALPARTVAPGDPRRSSRRCPPAPPTTRSVSLLSGAPTGGRRCSRRLARRSRGARWSLARLRRIMVMERYYITTPIYYVNSTPHIGHAYTTIAADILARNRRQRGVETFFLTGVDEHAAKVARVAAEQGLSPQEYADQIAVVWRELPERLNASNDFFIRTSDEEHKRFVQGFLQRLYDNGHVYQDVYAGLYCVGCEAFKTEADLVDGKCPEHDREPEWIEERNWFFRLSSFQEQLLELFDRGDFVQPGFRANEARSFVEGGLQDFSISRAGQTWGIPIPWDPDSVAYVWADALVNYLSALTYARPGEDLRRDVLALGAASARQGHPALPLRLLAGDAARCGLRRRRDQLFVHGWLLLDDRKISKSLGNVVDPARPDRRLRRRPGAVLVRRGPSRSARTARPRSWESTSATSASSATTSATCSRRTTAMVARYRGGTLRALPVPDGRRRRRARPARGRCRRPARRFRRHRCAGANLGGRPGAQPRGRVTRAVAAGEGRGAGGRPRPRPLRSRRRPPRRRGRPVGLCPGDRRIDPRSARASRAAVDWSLVAYGLTGETERDRSSPSALPPARAARA